MKEHDKVYCINDMTYINGNLDVCHYIKDKTYIISQLYDDTIWIKSENTVSYYFTIDGNYNENRTFSHYFVTLKELIKIKLDKINERTT